MKFDTMQDTASLLILNLHKDIEQLPYKLVPPGINYDFVMIIGTTLSPKIRKQLLNSKEYRIIDLQTSQKISKGEIYLTPENKQVILNDLFIEVIDNPSTNSDEILKILLESITFTSDVTVRYINRSSLKKTEFKVDTDIQVEIDKYRSIFDNSLVAFFQTDANGKILEVNAAASEMLGYTVEEMKTLGREGIIESSESYIKLLKDRKSHGTASGIVTAIRKSGEKILCEYSSKIFKTSKGAYRASTTLVDVNKRKLKEQELKETSKFMKMILDNTTESFIILDKNLDIVSFNKPAEDFAIKLINVPLQKGNSIFTLAEKADHPRLQEMYNYILQGNSLSNNYTLKNATDQQTIFKISYSPVKDENDVYSNIMINAKDITVEEKALQVIREERGALQSALDENQRIMRASPDIICSIDNSTGKLLRVSEAMFTVLGYHPSEVVGKSFIDTIYVDDIKKTKEIYDLIVSGKNITNFQNRNVKKDGSIVPLIWSATFDRKDNILYAIGRDASEKIKAEKTILESEEKYKHLFYSNPLPMWIYNLKTKEFLEVNDAAINHYGYSRAEFLSKTIFDIRSKEAAFNLKKVIKKGRGIGFFHHVSKHLKKNGQEIEVDITSHVINYNGSDGVLVSANDVTERMRLEQHLIKYNETVRTILESITDGFLSVDKNWTINYCNSEAEKLIGKKTLELEGLNLWDVNNETIPGSLYQPFNQAMFEKKAKHIEHYIEQSGIWLEIIGYPSNDGLSIYFKNITERKIVEKQINSLNNSLEKRAAELIASNQELENFAYVASHDLQEPLRMITSFLQLLEMKYHDTIDAAGKKYISFAVDGASRMNNLILDLLEYSKVGRTNVNYGETDMNEIVEEVLENFQQKISATRAKISTEKLPVLKKVVRSQMYQLMQNLIGNALKYQHPHIDPIIKINCEKNEEGWLFSIKDNGIGIDDKFASKIFVIFQRLHSKNEYSGTGIGLAICKKIIDLLGGKIWVESINEGSTFWFLIPE